MRPVDELFEERAERGEARGADAVFDAAEAAAPDAEVVSLGRRRPIAPLAVAAAVLAIVASVAVTAFWGDDESPSDVAIGTDDGAPAEGARLAVMEIPALGITADVVEGIGLRQTAAGGVGHLPESALPGEAGPVVLIVPGPCAEGPFTQLGDLADGDQVLFSVGQGVTAYEVTRIEVVDQESGGWMTATGQDDELTLSACNPDGFGEFVTVTAALVGEPLSDAELRGEVGDLTQLLGKPTDEVVVLDDGYGTVTMLAPEDRLGVRWDVTAGLSTQPQDWQQVRIERLGEDLVVGWDGGVHLVPLDGDDPVLLGEATTFAVAEEADGVWLVADALDALWEATLVARDGEALVAVEEPILDAAQLGLSEAAERALRETDAGVPGVDLSRLDATMSSFDLHEVHAAANGLVVSTDGYLGHVDADGNATVLRSALRIEGDVPQPDGSPVDVLDVRDDRVLWCEGDDRCSFLHLSDVAAETDEQPAHEPSGWVGGAFSPDGSMFAVAAEAGSWVEFYDEDGRVDAGQSGFAAGSVAGERSVIAWDPDGEAVYVTTASPGASATPLARFGTDGSVHLADLPFGGVDGDVVVLDRASVGDLDDLPTCSDDESAARCSFPLE